MALPKEVVGLKPPISRTVLIIDLDLDNLSFLEEKIQLELFCPVWISVVLYNFCPGI